MGKLFGYARVSTEDQSLVIQADALKAAGVNEALIFAEKASGTSREGRPELARVLALMNRGDTLVIMRLDRLMRSMKDYSDIVHDLALREVGLKCTHEPIDASGPLGMLVMDMLAAIAAFETRRRAERQREGIAKARQAGAYKGRKPTARAKGAEVRALRAQGVGPADIARQLKIGRASVYRALK